MQPNPAYNTYYAVIGGTICLLILFAMSTNRDTTSTNRTSTTPPPTHTATPTHSSGSGGDKTYQRHISNEEAFAALSRLGKKMKEGGSQNCDFEAYGTAWGAHELCLVSPASSCR